MQASVTLCFIICKGRKDMNSCKKCNYPLQDGWIACPVCGTRTVNLRSSKKRGNGQGTIIKQANGKYKAIVTLGYHLDEEGHLKRHTATKTFDKRTDAVSALPTLKTQKKGDKTKITLRDLYERWLPTHKAGKSTIDCYKAAFRYFHNIENLAVSEIDVDDLQECIDDCPHGKRTKENMRACIGLMYKYGIPRHLVPDNLNLAQFLTVDGDPAAHRSSFTDVEIEKIKKACGIVPHAELIYIMIYLGFRPSEFLALTKDDIFTKNGIMYAVGGAKTEAGKGRIVTVSPKIQPYVTSILREADDYFVKMNIRVDRLKVFTRDIFYPTLEEIGINNPIVEISGGKTRHKYTPHSCRHTFATLMKRVGGADKDKQELIGHASTEMLRYYQDTDLEDLRQITDAI